MSDRITVSDNPDRNWANDHLQFARLLGELYALGGFTAKQRAGLRELMDLGDDQLDELLSRAQTAWDRVKAKTK